MNNSWRSGQDGYGILLTVRNQDGKNPYATIEDIEISNCILDNLGAGVQILGQDYSHPSNIMSRVKLLNNKFTNIDGSNGRGMQIFISRGSKKLTIQGNEFYGERLNSFLSFDDPTVLNEDLVVDTNTFQQGEYGIFGVGSPSLGTAALQMYAPGYKWKDITVNKGDSVRDINYPSGTTVIP
jgi:hypothetical protein